MSDSAVKVAVRVRPFNAREQSEGAALCVSMEGKLTRLFNKQTNYTKDFYFDYSYWSHDGFSVDERTGIMYKDSPASNYADQKTVFNDLGIGVLDNAWEGYHCCLFAYGQTGSGKSYSMVGYGPNRGIIPIACEEIFRRIQSSETDNVDYTVKASMLEIYNEQIQDLLEIPSNRVKGGLKVREDPKNGVFVEGLKAEVVKSYEEIEAVLDKGSKHRTVAATQMNATSSRAHTVLCISFTQLFFDKNTGKQLNRKESNINLVDLAGSERAGKTGAVGDRLQEGSNINRSLSTLGKVITALAKKSSGSLGRNEVIPYRESKLTRILQNALGGNSKTTMIAAISPATYNFDETLSTLRYADAVKAIKNQAVINETPQEKLIRELKEQNEKLKAMLEGRSPSSGSNEYEQMIEELKRAKEDAEKTWQEKLAERNAARPEKASIPEEKITSPYIKNLNEDPLLSGYIKHVFKEGVNRIGKRDPENMPDIPIDGLGIGADHCCVIKDDDTFKILPSDDPMKKTTVNGVLLLQERELEHNDRIRFGNHNFFIFKDPEEIDNSNIDWEYAVNEANAEQVKLLLGSENEELKRKQEEMKEKLEAEMQAQRAKIEEEQRQLQELLQNKAKQDSTTQQTLLEREEQMRKKHMEMEEELRRKEAALKKNENDRLALERLKQLLSQAIQQINEANERAIVLNKNVMFQPELYREKGRHSVGSGLLHTNVRVRVIYPELSEDIKITWSLPKLDARLIDMQEICNQLAYGANPADIDLTYDPFSDSIDQLEDTYQLIGNSYIWMDLIYNLLPFDEDLVPLIDERGSKKGMLRVSLVPEVTMGPDDDFENVKEVLGKKLRLTMNILEAVDIPANLTTDVYCEYSLDDDEVHRTEKAQGSSTNPQFNYKHTHELLVTDQLIEDLANQTLCISVYGDMARDKKAREMDKLKVVVEKDKEAMSGLSPGLLNSEDVDTSQVEDSINNLGDVNDLRYILEQKNNEYNELLKQQHELEQELNQKQQLLTSPVQPVENKSKSCAIF